MDNLQVILLEESEFTDHNYELMQSALEYRNSYMFFYKHIKFSDEAPLCISYHKIKAGVIFTVCLLQ